MTSLTDVVHSAIAEPVVAAGVFRTPVVCDGYGIGGLVRAGAGWIWRRWRSTAPNYVVLACTANELLMFGAGRRVGEIGRLLRRAPLERVRARPDGRERLRFQLVVDGDTVHLTNVTFDKPTHALVDMLAAPPESRRPAY